MPSRKSLSEISASRLLKTSSVFCPYLCLPKPFPHLLFWNPSEKPYPFVWCQTPPPWSSPIAICFIIVFRWGRPGERNVLSSPFFLVSARVWISIHFLYILMPSGHLLSLPFSTWYQSFSTILSLAKNYTPDSPPIHDNPGFTFLLLPFVGWVVFSIGAWSVFILLVSSAELFFPASNHRSFLLI